MPPRSVKRASVGASSGTKKTAVRTARGARKAQQNPLPEPAEEATIVEEKPAEPEPEPEADGSGEEEDVKEVYVEEDIGEHLELEDNEPEYDPEEDPGMDYGEREIENDDGEEEGDQGEGEGDQGEGEGDQGEEEGEDGDAGEDEFDMIEEEMEDGGEDVEGEEDDENAEEEQDGEEEEEHHDVVKEHCKRKEFEVFVGGLDKDATEDDLKKVFSVVGEIVEVRLMRNPQTKKNKGFAFLRFATVEQAKRAISELKNPVVNGKKCGVAPSQDSDTLFLGNICKTWTKGHLKEKLKQYGVENVEDLTLVEDSNNEGMNRGFAFLEFASRSDAMDAFRCLQKRDVVFGVDRSAKVAFADSFSEPDDEIMAQVKTVFVDGLPAAWDEDRVEQCLEKFGAIEKVELARNMPSARRKDFGFVTFDTHAAAVSCAEGINNADLGEGDNKVRVRARLSRPHQRVRGKRGPTGDFRIGRETSWGSRLSWSRPAPRRFMSHGTRAIRGRSSPISGHGFQRAIGFRGRRPVMAAAERGVRHPPPPEQSYNRRRLMNPYPKSSLKRDYTRPVELLPRSRAIVDYGSRVPAERRSSYRDEYTSHGSDYADVAPRSASRTASRRGYTDEGYGRRIERPLPAYREGHDRDYDLISGSKRSYAAIDDDPPRHIDVSVRQSGAHYGASGSSAQYQDAYGERIGRSHVGYGGSRSSLSGHGSHSVYGSRQGIGYAGGSVSSGDVGGMYSSSYDGGAYMSRSDVGGSSYSSLYSGRKLSGNGYLGSSGSGSYY